jgi:hypothetical protein
VFNAYGDIMYTFFGAVAASPIDLSRCSQWCNAPGGIMYTLLGAPKLFNVPGGIIYTVPGAAAMSFDLSKRLHVSNAYGDIS